VTINISTQLNNGDLHRIVLMVHTCALDDDARTSHNIGTILGSEINCFSSCVACNMSIHDYSQREVHYFVDWACMFGCFWPSYYSTSYSTSSTNNSKSYL